MDGPETLYVEPTNRCNLRCTTCPHTYFEQEPPADMTPAQFRRVLDEVPTARRIVLHGMGEPLLNPHIADFVRLARERAQRVLFNTNGQLLTREVARGLVKAGLDELRVSVDLPDPERYPSVRRGGQLDRVYEGIRALNEERAAAGVRQPLVSFWMMEGRSRLSFLDRMVEDAARLGVTEVYLQRLILLGTGDAVASESVFRKSTEEQERQFAAAAAAAAVLGVTLWGSGDENPAQRGDVLPERPWSECLRPFQAAYVTVHGNLLPCCLTPFTAAGRVREFMLGNVFTQPFAELWTGPAYEEFRRAFRSAEPPACCLHCGSRWSL